MRIIEMCPKCGHDLIDSVIAVIPPIYKKECPRCGWQWEGKREQDDVIRVPFGGYAPIDFCHPDVLQNNAFDTSACSKCPNNPANGGSGVCLCTLGQQTIYG